jgi:hypothetical protein
MNCPSPSELELAVEAGALSPPPSNVFTVSPSLKVKLKYIYRLALSQLLKSESRKESTLKKNATWSGIADCLNVDLDFRIDQCEKLVVPKDDEILCSYKKLLQQAGLVRKSVRLLANSLGTDLWAGEKIWFSEKMEHNVFQVLSFALDARSAKHDERLDTVLVDFYDLQVSCYSMACLTNIAKGVPLKKSVRVKKASVGGVAASAGAEVLRAMLIEKIRKLPIRNDLGTIEKFFDENSKGFYEVLANYKAYRDSGTGLGYWVNMEDYNFPRVIRKWCQESYDLRVVILRAAPSCKMPKWEGGEGSAEAQ